jgi:CBS domain containing-hemolysin-like protein
MFDIFSTLLFIFTISVASICSAIVVGINDLNHFSLKQQARRGDKRAATVYPFHFMRRRVTFTLRFVGIFFEVIAVALLIAQMSTLWAVIFGSIILFVFSEVVARVYLQQYTVYFIATAAPVLRRILNITAPIVRPLDRIFGDKLVEHTKSSLTKEELLSILDSQKKSKTSSGFSSDDVHMLQSVLAFSDKKIRDVMTPRRMVTVVAKDDEAGPILMDELHSSGFSRFPVIAEPKQFNFVGTLYLRDLVGEKTTKKVSEKMSPEVRYIHEEESLDHALRAFLKTHHHLFVVVNNFEEFVGVLSIEDVLEEIIGKEIIDEFDKHDDLRAVASSIAEKERSKRA